MQSPLPSIHCGTPQYCMTAYHQVDTWPPTNQPPQIWRALCLLQSASLQTPFSHFHCVSEGCSHGLALGGMCYTCGHSFTLTLSVQTLAHQLVVSQDLCRAMLKKSCQLRPEGGASSRCRRQRASSPMASTLRTKQLRHLPSIGASLLNNH